MQKKNRPFSCALFWISGKNNKPWKVVIDGTDSSHWSSAQKSK